MTTALARPIWLDLDSFAHAAGLHPLLLRRLVALGLVEPVRDVSGQLWFTREELARVARIQRLRAAFSLNYAAIGLVVELLDRIAELEAERHGVRPVAGRPRI